MDRKEERREKKNKKMGMRNGDEKKGVERTVVDLLFKSLTIVLTLLSLTFYSPILSTKYLFWES